MVLAFQRWAEIRALIERYSYLAIADNDGVEEINGEYGGGHRGIE
jgi:hypothetical protein